jgi:hypothetical protein
LASLAAPVRPGGRTADQRDETGSPHSIAPRFEKATSYAGFVDGKSFNEEGLMFDLLAAANELNSIMAPLKQALRS